jgi:hypothetical protein
MVTRGARLMKYTLIAEDEYGGSKTTREFEVDALPQVLEEVELFLRGVGFYFNGNLDFVNDFEEPQWDDEDFQETYDPPHVGEMYDTMDLPSNNWPFEPPSPKTFGPQENSHYYFDTERNK